MALTESTMLELGTKAPSFSLTNAIDGQVLSLNQLEIDKGLLIMFICNHCPYVIHYHDFLKELQQKYLARGISLIAISSNDVKNYPDDSPEKMKQLAQSLGLKFPYLYDETQEVAKAYKAACTPDNYLFDNDLKCVYRGRFDDSSPGNGRPVTGKDIYQALDALIEGSPLEMEQFPSMGCNIKWKK